MLGECLGKALGSHGVSEQGRDLVVQDFQKILVEESRLD